MDSHGHTHTELLREKEKEQGGRKEGLLWTRVKSVGITERRVLTHTGLYPTYSRAADPFSWGSLTEPCVPAAHVLSVNINLLQP